MRRKPASRKHDRELQLSGYTFGPHRYKKDGHWYLRSKPSKKAVSRIKEKVETFWAKQRRTMAGGAGSAESDPTGLSAYFSYGTRTMAYRAVDNHVYDSVRHFLRRRHKVQSRGTSRFSDEVVFGELGVLRLRDVQLNPRS